MTDNTQRAQDLSRYLEETRGETCLPADTPLHIVPDDGQSSALRVRRVQSRFGVEPEWFAIATWEHLMHRFPHGVAWTDFPVLLPPSWISRRSHRALIHRSSNGNTMPAGVEVADAIGQAKAVFLHLDRRWSGEQEAERMLPVVDVLSRSPGVERIVVAGAGWSHERTLSELQTHYAWHLPILRFDYNYRVNFRAIAGKALLHALRTSPAHVETGKATPGPGYATPEQVLQSRIAQIESGHYRGVDDPMLLQFLFRLKRQGPLPMAEVEKAAILRLKGGEFWWRGTGSKPDVQLDRLAVVNAFAMPGARNILLGWRDGAFHLTAAAEKFLDLIHPDMEDPDLLCRWTGRQLEAADGKAMDSWIISKFRKTKTRVNAIDQPV